MADVISSQRARQSRSMPDRPVTSNFAAVATTEAWTAAVTAGEALPKSDLGTSATQGRAAFGA